MCGRIIFTKDVFRLISWFTQYLSENTINMSDDDTKQAMRQLNDFNLHKMFKFNLINQTINLKLRFYTVIITRNTIWMTKSIINLCLYNKSLELIKKSNHQRY